MVLLSSPIGLSISLKPPRPLLAWHLLTVAYLPLKGSLNSIRICSDILSSCIWFVIYSLIFFVFFPTYLHSILYTKMICFYTDISYCPIFDILWRYSFLLEIPWSLIYSSSVVSLLTCAHDLDTLLHSKALLPSIHTTVLVFFLSLVFYTLVQNNVVLTIPCCMW